MITCSPLCSRPPAPFSSSSCPVNFPINGVTCAKTKTGLSGDMSPHSTWPSIDVLLGDTSPLRPVIGWRSSCDPVRLEDQKLGIIIPVKGDSEQGSMFYSTGTASWGWNKKKIEVGQPLQGGLALFCPNSTIIMQTQPSQECMFMSMRRVPLPGPSGNGLS